MRLASLLAAVVLPALLSACNMAEGAGKDISAAGATITDTADDSKGY
jgi:predicted small secreted protein